MSREALDMAVPISLEAASDYYRQNMTKILNSTSTSTINSTKNEYLHDMYEECGSTSTSSDSEIEDQITVNKASSSKNIQTHDIAKTLNATQLSTVDNDQNIQTKLQNINSVAVNNSSDVHIGNKTFFNGPITIKQIVLNNENNNEIKSSLGTVNQGFEGSLSNLASKNDNDASQNKKQEEINKVQQNNNHISNTIKKFFTRKKILLTVGGLLILVSVSIVLIFTLTEQEDDSIHPNELKIISRKEWNAEPASGSLTDLILPVNRVIIAHTVNSECYTKDTCLQVVREIQQMHFGKGFEFSDIGYNFIIGGDGNVYEGRGWLKQGAHTSGYNAGSIGVGYVGNFVDTLPNQKQISAGFKLFAEGVRLGMLSTDYVIYGASQLRNTESPGKTFLEIIKKWPHAVKDI